MVTLHFNSMRNILTKLFSMPAQSDIPAHAILKHFLLIYLPIITALSIILFSAIYYDKKSLVRNTVIVESSRIDIAIERITRDVASVETDLRIIANLLLLQRYLDNQNQTLREKLEKDLLVLARETRRYDQLRYLDLNGQEVIRINYNNGQPSIVPRAQLQNKAERYYFSNTIKLNRNEIYVSPFDLNIEHGALEVPYKPIMRFGTPVFDSQGQKAGIIVLNYLGDELLQNFRTVLQDNKSFHSMLLNSDGYWLKGLTPGTEWGFMLGDDTLTFEHDYPDVWHRISTRPEGSLLTDKGLFIFSSVHPLPKEAPSLLVHIADQQEARESHYYWTIVSFIPDTALFTDAFYNQPWFRILLFATYVLLALASLLVTRIILSRAKARQEIFKLNAELKMRVAEHTAGKEQLSITLNSIADGVITTDSEARVTRLNPIAEQLTGWTQSTAAGRPLAEVFNIIDQKTRRPTTVSVMDTITKGESYSREGHALLMASNGSECTIADSCAPIRDTAGESVRGAVLVFRDITQEYAAQEALRESAMRIKTVLNSVGEGIYGIDMDGNIMFVNLVAANMLGWNEQEMIGQSAHKLIHHSRADGSFYPQSECPIYASLRDNRSKHLENEVYWRKDGSSFPASYHATPMPNDSGETVGVIVSFRDITDRKRNEESLILAKNAAEQANQAKDSFLATMSHEIRTPLTGILGMLEVLSLTQLDNEQDKTLKAAWSSARNLLRIVNDILDWSKIQDGKLALSPQSTSIPALLADIVNTYSSVASAKNLQLWQHADPQISSAHIVDPMRLSQILNNFVSNALKFTQQGEVELRAELIDRLESGEKIRFSVKDSGIGIARDIQQNLFKRFRQESADTARQYGGTGLGLSISRCLAELLDGQIELISEPGRGATFSITVILPISAAPGEKIPLITPVVEQKRVTPLFDNNEDAPLILAVDDHPINRDLLARQIRLLGLRAETAEHGQDALIKWKTGRFDMVITDCHMPEMDGYSFAQAVRNIEKEQRQQPTPIVAWTANARTEEEQFCKDAGMDDLLVKPCDLLHIKKILVKWLSLSEADENESRNAASARELISQHKDPIDYTELSKVITDSTEQVTVLLDFQQHIRADRAHLIALLEQGDSDVQHTAHRMKGSCQMVGATEMAKACATIEQAVKNGDFELARSEMKALGKIFEQLDNYLSNLKALQGDTDETG